MGDLAVDLTVMHGVARQVQQALTEFGSERTLSEVDSGAFGSDMVTAAFASSARLHDEMVRSLSNDASTLSEFVEAAGATLMQADEGLARSAQ